MKSSTVPVVAAGVLSISVLVLLYILRKREKTVKSNDQTVILKEFEFEFDGTLLTTSDGKKSKILYAIENRTRTEIQLHSSANGAEVYSIKGLSDDIEIANNLLKLELSKPIIITEELEVPSSSCGKIEGYSGSVLLEICSKSSAKVWVDPSSRKPYSETRKVLITGTYEQVSFAKELINEKIRENESSIDEGDESSADLVQSKKPNSQSKITSVKQRKIFLPALEKLETTSDGGEVGVFVSAARSPSQMYLQRADGQSTELDYLVDSMSQYYSSKTNRELHTIRELYLGQICAAMLLTDNKWYRAEIVEIQMNETLPEESLLLEVFFLDFGDRQFVTQNNIFELTEDFMSLRFQAIECFLANVKPLNNKNADEWDSKALEKFEDLVQPSKWKKMTAKVVSYKEKNDSLNGLKIDHSPIPGIELCECSGDGRNVGAELIKLGFAKINDEQFGDLRKSSILNPSGKESEKVQKIPDVSIDFVIKNLVDEKIEDLSHISNEDSNIDESVTSEIDEMDEPPSITSLNIDPDESDDDDTEHARFTVSLPVLQRKIISIKRERSREFMDKIADDNSNSKEESPGNNNNLTETTSSILKDTSSSSENTTVEHETTIRNSHKIEPVKKTTNNPTMRDWNEMLEDD